MAFRLFYFLLLLFPLFYTKIEKKILFQITLFFPYLIFILTSSLIVEWVGEGAEHAHPLFRASLFILFFFFLWGMSHFLKNKRFSGSIILGFKLYLISSLLVGLFGLACFIGYYTGIIDFAWLEQVSIETQIAYHVLRMGPFTYPNEFGVQMSFALTLSLICFINKEHLQLTRLKRFALFASLICFFFFMLMTTTRAAIVSLSLSLCCLMTASKSLRKNVLLLLLVLSGMAILTECFYPIITKIAIPLLSALFDMAGSSLVRMHHVQEVFDSFKSVPFLGTGQSTQFRLHNVYLAAFFELGIVGTMLLLLPLLYLFIYYFDGLCDLLKPKQAHDEIIRQITLISLLHSLSFGLTNHNLYHHLFWLSMILLLRSCLKFKEESAPSLLPAAHSSKAFLT